MFERRSAGQVTSAIESLQAQAVRFTEALRGIGTSLHSTSGMRCSEAKPGAGTAHLAEEKARALGPSSWGDKSDRKSSHRAFRLKAAKMLGSKAGAFHAELAVPRVVFGQDIPAGMCSDELEINDYPQIARQKITHRDFG